MFAFSACTLKEGMRSPLTMPSDFITSLPITDDVESVRPGNDKKWTVPKASNPQLLLQLVPAGDKALPLGKLVVKGDIPGVTVYIKPSEEEDFQPVSTGQEEEPEVRSLVNILLITAHYEPALQSWLDCTLLERWQIQIKMSPMLFRCMKLMKMVSLRLLCQARYLPLP